MIQFSVDIITKSEELPSLLSADFFHSPELFAMMERTSGITPLMVVAKDVNGSVKAQLLASLRRRGAWLPPYLFTQGRAYGEGVYATEENKEEYFAAMLHALTTWLHKRLCLYIEFSDISRKMFGYRSFRQNNYFPVSWMQIHNSLHNMEPELRLEEKTLRRIHHAYDVGIETRKAANNAEIHAFYRLLKAYYRFRFQRYIPAELLFQQLATSNQGAIFVTTMHEKIIGGSAVVYSRGNAYLWFEASRRKRYPLLHPDLLTTWNAIKTSHQLQNAHISFMNVGLPFKRNAYRDFILGFGGKPVSSYRWFHFTFNWLNRLCLFIFSE